jgi:hypothetical protein
MAIGKCNTARLAKTGLLSGIHMGDRPYDVAFLCIKF